MCFMSSTATQAEIDAHKEVIINKLTSIKKPILIEKCMDLILSQITATFNEELNEIFSDYFERKQHDPLDAVPVEKSLKKYFESICPDIILLESENPTSYQSDLGCCLPCSCITLGGNRAIKEYKSSPSDNRLIRTIRWEDSVWDLWAGYTDIESLGKKVLEDFEYNGKNLIEYDSLEGFICQIMINQFNNGSVVLTKQRISKSIRSLGMIIGDNDGGFDLNKLHVSNSMDTVILLFAQIEHYYQNRRVVNVLESVAGRKESSASLASIQETIITLKAAAENFKYGSIAYLTLKSIMYKIGYFYLLFATKTQLEINQANIYDVIDAARNKFIKGTSTTPSETSNTRNYMLLAKYTRNFLMRLLSMDLNEKNLKIQLDLDETLVETIIELFKKGTSIDLTEKRYLHQKAVIGHRLPNKL
jgi:hypothetical protein